MDVTDFKNLCISSEPDLIVQKYLIDGSSYYFDQIQHGDEFEFKKEIATFIKVHIRDIVIVGSGKLGFSIKPAVAESGLYLFKKFDFDYEQNKNQKKSDLDIAIVSSGLFDKEIENLYSHAGSYKNFVWEERNAFAKNILKGRFIIRFLPIGFPLSKELEVIQNKQKMRYGRDVNLEIYKSWFFFESYHVNNILNIKLNLIK